MNNSQKVKYFSFKKIVNTVGTVFKTSVGSFLKIGFMKTNFPESEEAIKKKMAPENLALSVGLPPAEVLVGKALAYGTVDSGFETIASVLASEKSVKYNLITDTPKDFGIKINGNGNGNLSGGNNMLKIPHGPGLRAPSERVGDRPGDRSNDRSSQEGHSTQFPNTSPLTRDEMSNIVPFRSYTFYSDLDGDKFENYKGSSVLAASNNDVSTSFNHDDSGDVVNSVYV